MKTAPLMLLFVATASPVLAESPTRQPGRAFDRCVRIRPGLCEPSGFGTGQSYGSGQRDTAVQERRARQCLAKGD